MPPPPEHSYPPGERIVRLETEVAGIRDDIARLEEIVKPLADAFLQAKGAQRIIWILLLVALYGLGAGTSKILEILASAFKPP
ncbi:hypothetical protein SAMN05519104_6652 [Rhizobiales bacterium GAS188]|nr:hypothetical protein SAMN05519104_6652 [Rhizobiales bacterium GAS188]